MKSICTQIIVLSLLGMGIASGYRNRPIAIISENQKYIAELTPYHQCGYEGRGTVYQMNGNVKGDSLWSFDWFGPPYKISLLNSGERIVYCKSEGYGQFIVSGDNISKQYAFRDLIQKQNKVKIKSTLGFEWFADSTCVNAGFNADSTLYTIVLADQTVYTFDIRSGEIVDKSTDSCAMNFLEYRKAFQRSSKGLIKSLEKDYEYLNTFRKNFKVTLDYISPMQGRRPFIIDGSLIVRKRLPYKPTILFTKEITVPKGEFSFSLSSDSLLRVVETVIQSQYLQKEYNPNRYILEIWYSYDNLFQRNSYGDEILRTNNFVSSNKPEWIKLGLIKKSNRRRYDSFLYYHISSGFVLKDHEFSSFVYKLPYSEEPVTITLKDPAGIKNEFKYLKKPPDFHSYPVLSPSDSLFYETDSIELFQHPVFYVKHPKLTYQSSYKDVLEILGEPERKHFDPVSEEEVWIYMNSYITYVRFSFGMPHFLSIRRKEVTTNQHD